MELKRVNAIFMRPKAAVWKRCCQSRRRMWHIRSAVNSTVTACLRRRHGPDVGYAWNILPKSSTITVPYMPAMLLSPALLPILLLIGSNVFMTLAWYGHLRFKETPLIGVIMASWGIAFAEYCMAVPANRLGSAVYTTAQLKTIQEIVTLLVFAGFSILYLKEPITWNYAIGFVLVAAGAFFIFRGPL
jgi:uncharacterized protein (DUF486 family)